MSGNNIISGTQVGIGTNTPLAKIHVNNNTGNTSEIRLQHTASLGSSRFAFFADNSSAFTATDDYAVMNKYTVNTIGTLTSGFSIRSLYAFSNSKGGLFFTAAANVGLGQWNTFTNIFSTRLFIDSALGNIGIGNVAPLSKLHIHGSFTSDAIKFTNTTTGINTDDTLNLVHKKCCIAMYVGIITRSDGLNYIYRRNNTALFEMNEVHKNSYLIYPNPAFDKLQISNNDIINEYIKYEILSLDGKLIAAQQDIVFNTHIEISIKELAHCFYFLKMYRSNDIEVLKFRKE